MSYARWMIVALVLLAAAAGMATRGMGLSVRRTTWPAEAAAARAVRDWTLPDRYRSMRNPIGATPEALRAGMDHWADHCASCHGNDGSGQVAVGRNLSPPAPDMREPATQRLSDGALFYAIEEGVPFTGMPAWSTGTADGERQSWELVLFIRHLSDLTAGEIEAMERRNPRSAGQAEQERQIEDFLKGGG